MVKVSACVIVKDEELHIKCWLDNMRKITKDLIVVDTGSADRTVELAKEGGARVFHFDWIDDFAAAKNFAIEQAKGDWIVFLDADEYFTDASLKNVRKYIEQYHRNPKADALVCKIINVDADAENELINEFYNLRIFRNVPWLPYKNKVHEMLTKANGAIQLMILDTGVEIYHTGYTKSIIRQKLERNLALLQKDIAEVGEQARHYRYLCDCYYGLEQYDLALKYARLHVASGQRSLGRDNSVKKRLIECLDLTGASEAEFLAEIDRQIAAYPDDPEFLWYKAEYLARNERYAEAETYFDQLLTLAAQQKQDFDLSTFEGRRSRIYSRLAQIACKKGDLGGAETSFREVVRRGKYKERNFLGWYRLLRRKDAITIIQALQDVYDKTERDLLFVYKMLQAFPRSKVHVYYQKLLKETLGIQVITSASADLLGAGQYARAAAVLSEAVQEAYAQLLLCAAAGKAERDLEATLLPKRYENVLAVLRGGQCALQPEEKAIYTAVENRLLACRGDLETPLRALRARYLQARQRETQTVEPASPNRGLLRFLAPCAEPLRILTLHCGEATVKTLQSLCPRAALVTAEASGMAREKAASYDRIVFGGKLNEYDALPALLRGVYDLLKADGFLLFSVDNAAHWENLCWLLQGGEGQGRLKERAERTAFFDFATLVELLRSARFSDVEVDPEESEAAAEAEALLKKLQGAGLLADARHFYTRCWHVRVGKMSDATRALQSVLSPQERRELVFLLRRIENDIDASDNSVKLLRFCEEKAVEAPYLAALIENSMLQKTKLFVELGGFFYAQGKREWAIRLLIAALKWHAQESTFVCTLAFLLDANGARQAALKVLAQFRGADAAVEQLRRELMS